MVDNKLNSAWEERCFPSVQRHKDHRSNYERDRARILHSAAFRRLQAKTQIHAVGESDFARTRLTHSLETAQIGSSLVSNLAIQNYNLAYLLPTPALIEGLCFAHDIGHPPFGHGGENALNLMMYQNGGFEGNAQTFRILSRLEPYTENAGMNLTRRTLLGIMKYPALIPVLSMEQQAEVAQAYQNMYVNMDQIKNLVQKGIYQADKEIFDWVLFPLSVEDKNKFTTTEQNSYGFKTLYKSLDCSIMELADDIAYGVHDLEDAIEREMVTLEQWQADLEELTSGSFSSWWQENIKQISKNLFSGQHFLRKQAIGALVHNFISHSRWQKVEGFVEPLLSYNIALPDQVAQELKFLKNFVYKYVIRNTHTQRMEHKGQYTLRKLFQIFSTNPERLLPADTRERWKNADSSLKYRIICDYIAGMTDNYALKVFKELSE